MYSTQRYSTQSVNRNRFIFICWSRIRITFRHCFCPAHICVSIKHIRNLCESIECCFLLFFVLFCFCFCGCSCCSNRFEFCAFPQNKCERKLVAAFETSLFGCSVFLREMWAALRKQAQVFIIRFQWIMWKRIFNHPKRMHTIQKKERKQIKQNTLSAVQYWLRYATVNYCPQLLHIDTYSNYPEVRENAVKRTFLTTIFTRKMYIHCRCNDIELR